jgi:hypothetical protein
MSALASCKANFSLMQLLRTTDEIKKWIAEPTVTTSSTYNN